MKEFLPLLPPIINHKQKLSSMSYTDEQLNKLYETLPQELQDAIFSGETADAIANACSQYGIEDERLSKIAGYTGDVLAGLILPSEFEDTIRKNVDMPEVLVKAIASEISRFVFYPHKLALEQLHAKVGEQKGEVAIPTPRHSERSEYIVEPSEKTQEQREEIFTEEQATSRRDRYRESVE